MFRGLVTSPADSSRTLMPRARLLTLCLISLALTVGACHKKADMPTGSAAQPAPSLPAAPVPPHPPSSGIAAPTDAASVADRQDTNPETTQRHAKLEYAAMEDTFLNDPNGQWAQSAKASSSFGEDPKAPPPAPEDSKAWRAVGKPDGKEWSQLSPDVGFDWLELGYEKPVHAREIRVVAMGTSAVEAITRIELIDSDGKATTIWSGLSTEKHDERGSRTWIVRKTSRTAGLVKAVKLTFANNVSSGYKDIDAVQLIGD